ncbi:uncharacterized protein LOC129725426 [Wyeomyia smithii]|uniref:uncharacterized protein LOC129725426 n=1 Tax=Wyeomyia smithii TaxID=174621 RepID=UPI00246807C3|nr:uncharacterized protein LOC129725426 [Wyeomyia smithii]
MAEFPLDRASQCIPDYKGSADELEAFIFHIQHFANKIPKDGSEEQLVYVVLMKLMLIDVEDVKSDVPKLSNLVYAPLVNPWTSIPVVMGTVTAFILAVYLCKGRVACCARSTIIENVPEKRAESRNADPLGRRRRLSKQDIIRLDNFNQGKIAPREMTGQEVQGCDTGVTTDTQATDHMYEIAWVNECKEQDTGRKELHCGAATEARGTRMERTQVENTTKGPRQKFSQSYRITLDGNLQQKKRPIV